MIIYSKYNLHRFPDGTMLLGDSTFPGYNKSIVHTGRVNETLLSIAYRYYGSHENWHIIAKANQIIDPWEDLVGKKLIIPIYD